jgi:hypothetical protein
LGQHQHGPHCGGDRSRRVGWRERLGLGVARLAHRPGQTGGLHSRSPRAYPAQPRCPDSFPIRQYGSAKGAAPKSQNPKRPFKKFYYNLSKKKHNSGSDQNQSILSFTKFIKILIILTCMISNRHALNIRFNDEFNDIYFSRVVPFYINLIKPYILNIPLI